MLKRYLSIAVLAGIAMNATASAKRTVSFDDISDQLSFERRNFDSASGLGGLAWFDYDNDGDIDLYLSNGPGQNNALFRNDGDDKFVDVTEQAGVKNGLGTSGVMAGDIDNDGLIDLFLVGAGGDLTLSQTSHSVIYRNLGNGQFSDVTAASGIIPVDELGRPGIVSSVWGGSLGDPDNDGDLDVFLVSPGNYASGYQVVGKFLRNDGDMKFSQVNEEVGLGNLERGSCASGFSDYDNDGDVDLFVAHCQKYVYDPTSPTHPTPVGLEPTPVQLFRNDGGLKFTDVTEASGLSQYKGNWMSVSFADMDHDGNIDFFSTNAGFTSPDDIASGIASAPHGLFRNKGDGTFESIAEQAGVAHWELSWGSSFADFDNDGYADLFFVGALPIPPAFLSGPGMANPGRLFMNDNSKQNKGNTFTQNIADGASIGLNLENEYPSGVAYGDFNNDGFQDLTILKERWTDAPDSGKPVMLKNTGNDNHWLGIQLQGTSGNKWGVGAKVMVKSGKMCQFQEIYAGSNFASTDSHRLNFGLGEHRRVGGVLVTWSTGNYELFTRQTRRVDRIHRLVEGNGRKISASKAARLMSHCE
jgi:hypothetical protein